MTVHAAQREPEQAPSTSTGWQTRLGPLTGFRPDVQVLRGVAVLLVVLFHADVLTPGGYVGVDVFFVISGYVISRRLIAGFTHVERRRTGLGQFYAHRARRILPPLAVLLVVVILSAPLLAPRGGLDTTSHTGIAAALFSANLYLYRSTGIGYFTASAELNPLLHTWSLSVEEQFYFVIPVLLIAAWLIGRRARRGEAGTRALATVRAVVALLVAVSFVACVAWTSGRGTLHFDGPRLAFFSPVSRTWEFAVGILLALLPVEWLVRGHLRTSFYAVGIGLIALAAFTFDGATRFPGWAALVPVLGAVAIIHAGTARSASPAHSWLAPVQRLGDLSYSWYLWHWPLIVYAAAFWPTAGRVPKVVAAVVSLAPAWISYRVLERGRVRAVSRNRTTIVIAIICIAAPVAAAVLARPVRTAVESRTADTLIGRAGQGAGQLGENAACGGTTPIGARPPECSVGPTDGRASMVLFGDSNAAMFSNALVAAAEQTDAHLEIATSSGCPLFTGTFRYGWNAPSNQASDCAAFIEGSLRDLERRPRDLVVVATGADSWVELGVAEFVDPRSGEWTGSVDDRRRVYAASLRRVLGRIRATGAQVALVEDVPKLFSTDPRNCSNLAILVDEGRCLPDTFAADLHEETVHANRLLTRTARRSGVETWDFTSALCPHSVCTPLGPDGFLYRDSLHISSSASTALGPAAVRLTERALTRVRR